MTIIHRKVASIGLAVGMVGTLGVLAAGTAFAGTPPAAATVATTTTTFAAPGAEAAAVAAQQTATLMSEYTASTAAESKLMVGAWLPYWQDASGSQEVALNLTSFNEVSPFSYEINSQGLITDDLLIGSGVWAPYFAALKSANVKIIPTIAYFDANGIYTLLSNAATRQHAEDTIAQLVQGEGFNGIDIDFEGMTPATRPYYSLFIEGLAMRLHPEGQSLTCTVVPRTPPSSLYVTPPANIVYPENYPLLNQYCDEVRLMAYDQEGVDLKLDASKGGNGTLYGAVADPDWVKKLVTYALQYISPKKIVLGIPTYGYEYEVSWANNVTTYQVVRAFDYDDAMARAQAIGVTPARNNAGELSFTYQSSTYVQSSNTYTIPSTEPAALMTPSSTAPTTFFVSFPDATSIMQKVALAAQYGLKGVMLFKADGQMDPAIWSQLP
jgi:spore germination protein YaaH